MYKFYSRRWASTDCIRLKPAARCFSWRDIRLGWLNRVFWIRIAIVWGIVSFPSAIADSVSLKDNSFEIRVPYPSFARALYGFSSKAEPFQSLPGDSVPDWLQGMGINTVFVSPDENPSILAALRKAGIVCLQEFTVFAGRSLYRDHPQWRPVAPDGEELKPDGWYYGLSPNHPELRQKRLDDFRQRLQNPHIQGIWLDFIRYAVRWEKFQPTLIDNCFSPASLRQFEQFAGIRLSPSDSVAEKSTVILSQHRSAWVDFKVNTIASWVEEACRIRDRERPEVWIGLFAVPWLPDDFDGAIRNIAGQDFKILAENVDVFSPMVYHRLCGKTTPWIGQVALSVQNQTGKPVWPIVQATGEPGVMDATEFLEAIREGARASKNGVILFTAAHIEKEKRWPEVKQIFHQLPMD